MTKITLKHKAYSHIRSKLLARELGPGSAVSHRELAKEIGISFTPVRDAIGQLASEGLLETHPQRGTYVPKLSRQDLAELYDIREAQECHAAGKMAGKMSEVDLAELVRLTDEMAEVADEVRRRGNPLWDIELADRWVVADAAFHMALLQAAGNRRALKIARELRIMVQIFGQRKQERPQDDLEIICGQHRAVITALQEGNVDNSRKFMAEHIRRGCKIALAAYDRNRIEEAAGESPSVTYPIELRERIQEIVQNPKENDS